MLVVALSLGLRKGEVSGLRVDFHVHRQLQWIKFRGEEDGHWIEQNRKQRAKRDLPFPEAVYRFLVRRLAKCNADAIAAGEHWHDTGYLFVNPAGTPIHTSNVSKAFRLTCARAGVQRIRFYDTRRTCGTMMHTGGADPFVIQAVLGHTQLSALLATPGCRSGVKRASLDGVGALYDSRRRDSPVIDRVTDQTISERPKGKSTDLSYCYLRTCW